MHAIAAPKGERHQIGRTAHADARNHRHAPVVAYVHVLRAEGDVVGALRRDGSNLRLLWRVRRLLLVGVDGVEHVTQRMKRLGGGADCREHCQASW